MSDVGDRVEYFKTVWPDIRERVDAFLEQCTCMNAEDKAVLAILLNELEDPDGIQGYVDSWGKAHSKRDDLCPKGGAHEPTEKLSTTICEKCRTVLKDHQPMKVPVKLEDGI